MRISDWSSDVCSSDLFEGPCRAAAAQARALLMMAAADRWDADWEECDTQDGFVLHGKQRLRFGEVAAAAAQLGRASCRERVCQYVWISVVAGSLSKKQHITEPHQYKHCESTNI